MPFFWISYVLLGLIAITLTLLEHSWKSMLVLLPLCQNDRLQDMAFFWRNQLAVIQSCHSVIANLLVVASIQWLRFSTFSPLTAVMWPC